MVRISATIALIALQFAAFAQYQFESKKAEKLYNKLEEYYAEADYEGILKNQNNIEELYLTKEDTLAALMYSFLAESELMLNSDVKKSIELYEKELALRNKVLKGDFEKKDLLFNIASLKDELGLYNETEELYLDMIASDEKEYGSKSKQYYESSYALADRYFQTQEIDKGQPLVRKLRRLVDKNSYEEAMVLKLSGDFKGLQGQYKKAEEEKLKGLRILEENGLEASLEYVFSLNNLATVYLEAGKIPLAEEAMLKAISIIDRLQGEHEDLKAALNGNLAQVYYEFGNYGQAEELYDEILETEKEFYGEESVDYGFTCYNVALNYLFGGNYSKSQEYNEKATAIFANTLGEESTDYARSINAMLILQVKKKNKELGLKYGQQAIGLYKKVFGNNNPNAAFPVFYLANIHQIFDNLDEAEKLHKEAYNLWRKSLGTNHPDFALSANKLATLNWKKEDYKTALEYYDQVFENYTNRINAYFPVLSEEEKSKFYYNSLKPAFEQFNSFIVETSPDQKELIGRMYDLQLTTKGIIMYATNKVRESIVNSGDSVLIDKYETWIGQKEQLAKLYSASDLDLDERNRKIDSLGESSNALEKELSKLSGVFAQTFTNRELTWRDVKAKLKPGEAAVEIIRFRDFTPDSS
ncbi:MAG: tetratricopeptide repeat protein, partial [Cyclobacteriaceae bacterium]|nr:tetratricopeptide repeat protein [Cyclobacteriaceae bacterium HetDA_MAG_MS6]